MAIRKFEIKVSPTTLLAILFFISIIISCNSRRQEIIISEQPQTNALIKKIDIHTPQKMDVFLRYWKTDNKDSVFLSPVSSDAVEHHFTLTGLQPDAHYTYQITSKIKKASIKAIRNFTTPDIPIGIHDLVNVAFADSLHIPPKFLKGYVMVYQREVPGVLMIVNVKGDIVWYKVADNTGFKVAEFIPPNNIIALMAPMSYPTSYSNEILEFSLSGDTILDLKKGEDRFKETIHHEILINDSNHLVTITQEEKGYDLSKMGGTKNDTVSSDGILVMNSDGDRLWHWSVFDVVNILNIPGILDKRRDLTHANSLSYDYDGNYLLSFYNLGQIWKINSITGKVMWKFGKRGDFTISNPKDWFQQSHTVYKISRDSLVLFENGTSDKTTRVLTYRLNEKSKTTSLVRTLTLPKKLFTPRMGSAYYVNDSTVLACSAQTGEVVLLNEQGDILWRLRTAFRPYRAAFIPSDALPLWNFDKTKR